MVQLRKAPCSMRRPALIHPCLTSPLPNLTPGRSHPLCPPGLPNIPTLPPPPISALQAYLTSTPFPPPHLCPPGLAALDEVVQLREALAAKQQALATTEAELAATKARTDNLGSQVGASPGLCKGACLCRGGGQHAWRVLRL